MSLAFGRGLRAIPGPSVMPDRVLAAMQRPSPNIYAGEIIELTARILGDLRRLARAPSAAPVIYIGNGHAAWEAALANLLAPGETALVIATGRFGLGWAEMARRMNIDVEVIDFGFRAPLDPARIEARLRADRAGRIRAVLTVQTDTASSVRNDIPVLRAAIDAAGHPALLAVDCIASLGCDAYEMEAWGVDVTLAACQKGLMTPPGLAYLWAGPRARAERRHVPSLYWDWESRIDPEVFYMHFCGTPPTHHLYAQAEALKMILDEEGLTQVWARHAALAGAVRAAAEAWGCFTLNIADPAARSEAVTTIRTAPGVADRLRAWCESAAGLTLGVPLAGPEEPRDAIFRIGHMGHLDPVMALGTLATIEAGLIACGVPHAAGAIGAAARAIAAAAPQT